ncbi:hypothetical protein C8R44DRAFT_562088, partial [Mycena epipterygia]
RIRLTDICTNRVTSDLLAYLASYSGLENLVLRGADNGTRTPEEANCLADDFFRTVLPHHATTLVELSCPAHYECRWSFGTHNVDAILQLHRLRILKMSVD